MVVVVGGGGTHKLENFPLFNIKNIINIRIVLESAENYKEN